MNTLKPRTYRITAVSDGQCDVVKIDDEYVRLSEHQRIVAQAEARGVEKFVNRLQQFLDEGDFVGDEVGVIAGAIYCGREMIEQLRSGKGAS